MDALADATVYLVGDALEWRCPLQRVLEQAGFKVAAYDDVESLARHLTLERPGAVVLNVRTPSGDLPTLVRRVTEHSAEMPVLLLAGAEDVPGAVEAMKAGAFDVIEPQREQPALLARIRHALRQATRSWPQRRETYRIRTRVDALTSRERQVMRMVVQGKTTRAIAADLGLSARTVEVHRARIMKKLQVDSVVGLVHVALRARLDPTT